jgi:hypothetical protein
MNVDGAATLVSAIVPLYQVAVNFSFESGELTGPRRAL